MQLKDAQNQLKYAQDQISSLTKSNATLSQTNTQTLQKLSQVETTLAAAKQGEDKLMAELSNLRAKYAQEQATNENISGLNNQLK